jgi:hypothetical protein
LYGFSGYGTNAYASKRLALIPPIVSMPMTVLRLLRSLLIQPQILGQGDYGYELPFTLEDSNGNPVDISIASLTLNVQDGQDPTQTDLISSPMVVDNGAGGLCHYTVAEGDFPNPGTFRAQIVATWSPEIQLTWSGLTIIVRPKLPQSNN